MQAPLPTGAAKAADARPRAEALTLKDSAARTDRETLFSHRMLRVLGSHSQMGGIAILRMRSGAFR